MLSHHLLLALRNLRRRAFFSVVNITGLGVGLATCWLIGLYVWHEKSFDRFFPHADRICAVALDLKMGEEEGKTTNTPPPLGPRLAADFPEIELAARTFYLQESNVRLEKPGQAPLSFAETGAYAADTSFLELFDFPMLEGDPATALDHSRNLVLSENAAQKYFGKNSAIGQTLLINDRPFTVSGVAKQLPAASTVQFDFLVPMADFKVVERFSWSWIWLQVDTWVRLRETPTPASLAALEGKFPAMVRKHAPAAFERIGQNFEEQLRKGDRWNVQLLPLPSLHLDHPNLSSRLSTLGDGTQVMMFGIIGLLILILASMNFMNLTTARASTRAREVGVRKALGSDRGTLVGQFLTESILYSSLGMVLATVLAGVSLPLFNQLTGQELGISQLFALQNLGLAAGLTVLTGLLGGLYPAFFLSKFQSGKVLKTNVGSIKGGHAGIRNGLVVFQFSATIALMLCSWMVLRQLEFAQKSSPGLNREHVLILPVLRNLENPTEVESFRQQISQLPEVSTVSRATFLPSLGSFGDFYEPEQGDQNHAVTSNLLLSSYLGDTRLVPALGLDIIAGRNFQDDTGLADSCSVILNEAAVRAIGWENPIGKWLRYPGNQNQRFQVVGIMRDFHLGSVRTAIEPAAIFHHSSNTYKVYASYLAVRMHPGTEKTCIEKTGKLWATAIPNAPFQYDFLDESFARIYRSEAKMGAVLSVFTGLALFIGCLGLFALAVFTAEQRTKEIGVRKVLGASVASVTALLARDFIKLVVIAIFIASPVAYHFMHKWLSNFAYHVDIQPWMFVLAGSAAIVIAFLTVSFQSIKAALANPVQSLRNE
ncbi:MAG: ABC transporter permease [Chitinophagales bacterium]|nr:ABC transporter permease [Chitinophagales bacterium]